MRPGDPLPGLKGIGPQRGAALSAAGLSTVLDLLQFLPRRYLDRRVLTPLSRVRPGVFASVAGVLSAVSNQGRDGLAAELNDPTGKLLLCFFHGRRFLKNQFRTGARLNAWGIAAWNGPRLALVHPGMEFLDMGQSPATGVFPVYPCPAAFEGAGLTSKVLQGAVRDCLDRLPAALPENLPRGLSRRRGFPPLKAVFGGVHFPDTGAPSEIAKLANRLKYEEAFLICLRLALGAKGAPPGFPLRPAPGLAGRVLSNLGFSLFPGQAKALGEIESDLFSGRAMRRLLQGDVGSGKTAVCALAAAQAAGNGCQAAVVAPTEILARQHFAVFQRAFAGTGIGVGFLSSGVSAAGRRALLSDLRAGRVQILTGTHALFGPAVAFKNLGLAVVDEQHRFGVAQRLTLARKGPSPHLLVASATPIPRTLALTLYGDLQISVIEGLPPGRSAVKTHRVPPEKRAGMHQFIREKIIQGGRAFFVLPLVEESGALREVKSVTAYAKQLQKGAFPGASVGLLHGRLSPKEKTAALNRFRSGETPVLAATSVVEVGVDIPEADVMVVENAERFGLAQLHQLRGRVGRGGRESFCFLLAGETASPEAEERLGEFAKTNDGFQIAELDFQTRGPGQMSGLNQSGAPEFRFLNLTSDLSVIECAREDASETAQNFEALSGEEKSALRQALKPYAGLRGELLETG